MARRMHAYQSRPNQAKEPRMETTHEKHPASRETIVDSSGTIGNYFDEDLRYVYTVHETGEIIAVSRNFFTAIEFDADALSGCGTRGYRCPHERAAFSVGR